MANNVAVQNEGQSRNMVLADYLMQRQEDFRQISTIDPERFLRVVKNALIRDPDIALASTQSIFIECQKAASDGLVLDGREAVLTRFKTNKKKNVNGKWVDNWQTEVVYIPMVAGIMKRVRNSGEVKTWSVGIVYQNEYDQNRFSYLAAPDPVIHHEPILFGDRGAAIAVYSAVQLRDGTYHYEVMRIDEVNAIMNRTKSKSRKTVGGVETETITGPWATDYNEMVKKTIIRRHAKRLPVASENMAVTERVDGLYDFDNHNGDIEEVETAPPAAKKPSAASKLRQASKAHQQRQAEPEQQPHEPEENGNGEENPPPAGEDNIVDGEIINDDGEVIGNTNPEVKTKPTSNQTANDEF